YRISGGSTQNRGVIPDIHLPAIADQMDVTETSLKNALPYDDVEPAQYARLDYVTAGKIKELTRSSAERVAGSREFNWVREDIERYKKQKEQKTITLNEAKRLEEKKEEEARAAARKKERAAHKAQDLTATEITLESLAGGGAKTVAKSTAAVTMPPDEGQEY